MKWRAGGVDVEWMKKGEVYEFADWAEKRVLE